VSKDFFRYVIGKELAAIGIPGIWKGKDATPADYVNEQKRRNLTFHGLRHTFITLGRLAGITDFEIQALAGHKSGAMMERYSHAAQVLDFSSAKEKLEMAVTRGT
jgi:integrase